MIDAADAIHDYLSAQTGITALTSTRIWAEQNVPAAGYKPSDGPGLAFRIRGGSPDYAGATLAPSVQIKCYGANRAAAQQLYRAVYDATARGGGNGMKSTQVEVLGQTIEEEIGGSVWISVLVFVRFWLSAS